MNRGLREWGWLIWLALLPWAPFILTRQLDLWHAQTAWGQGGLAILALVGMAQGLKPLANKPLACWLGWVSLLTLVLWHQGMLKHQTYPMPLLMGTGHLLMVGLLWAAFTSQWQRAGLAWLWQALTYAALIHVAYGVLQFWQLDQFFHSIDRSVATDTLVGMLGNPNHYGAWLVMMLPLFLMQEKRWWLGISSITIILILMTNSVGAVLAMFAGLLWWVISQPTRRRCYGLAALFVLVMFMGLWIADDVVNDRGRLTAYTFYWDIVQKRPITGWGPGIVMDISRGITSGPMVGWRHCHQELLQMLVEQGIVGASLLVWLVGATLRRAWSVRHDLLGAACGAGFVAVLFNAMVNFPFHLSAVAIPASLMAMTCWILAAPPDTGEYMVKD